MRAIKNNVEDYTVRFKNKDSSKLVDSNASFDKPARFDANVDAVEKSVKANYDANHKSIIALK